MIIKLNHPDVNLVWSTDWHLSAHPPGTRRRDDYQTAILKKLDFVADLTKKANGVAVAGGDVFHVKTPRSPANSVGLLIAAIRTLHAFPTGTVYGAIGNHDLSADRMDSLFHQPLGILIAAGVYHNLVAQPVIFENRDSTVRVLVEGFPYDDEPNTFARLRESGNRPPDVTYRVGIVHNYGNPGGPGNLWGVTTIGYDQLKELDYDFLLWGHDHSRKETVTVGNITHVNLGSLARAALPTDEEDRPVSSAVISFGVDGIKYQEKRIPVKPLELAFATADRGVERVAKLDEISDFFSSMDSAVAGIESTDPGALIDSLCGDDLALKQLVYELCEL
jgi:DNA repair exonuclease SbcCD nuclease subunit